MQRENQEIDNLAARHPDLFANGYGIGVWFGPGWARMLDRTFTELEKVMDATQRKRFTIDQIKEKFGTLRFYYHFHFDPDYDDEGIVNAIDAIVSEAERKSGELCYQCGALGKLDKKGGWYITSCGCIR